MPRLALVAPLLFSCVCAAVSVRAQDVANESPAHISVVDGAALLERDGRSESAPASMPLLAGDRVRTQNGRVEILFNEGSTLHLDTNSVVDFQSDEVIRLLDGRVRLNIVGGANRRVAYRVDAPFAWIEVVRTGEYRISVYGGAPAINDGREAEVELAVLRGAADLVNEDGRRSLGAGERAFARAGAAPSVQYVFNSASWDAFDRWSEARRDSRLGVAAEYLPDEVQAYASTFNQYGSWQNEPTYGYVWYPRARAGWRPYYYGSWTTLRPWGWTWIGSDPWAWPTHHYGRWGFSTGGWFWIPGRTWGPAWVSWAYAPGYVSWCPLGWNNRAVFGFNVGGYGGYRYNHWNGWTVVPHGGFGRGYVNANVINSTHIDVRTRNTFVVRDAAPDVRGYAVPRASAPIRSVGTPSGAVVNGNTAGNAAAYRGSRTRTAPGTAATADADSTAAFRSRRSSSAPLSGSGYPAPARTPRTLPGRARERCRRPPTAVRASSRQTRVRTPPQPDVPSLVVRASRRRRPLRTRLRRPDAHRSPAALRTRTLQASAAGLRSIGQCRAANVRRRETTTSTRQRPRMEACLAACRIAVIACRARPAHPVRMLRIAAARCHGRDRTAADRRTVIAPPSVPNPPRVLARGQAPSAARRDRRAHRRQRHHPSRPATRQAQGNLPQAQGRGDRRGHRVAVNLARVLVDRSDGQCHGAEEDRST